MPPASILTVCCACLKPDRDLEAIKPKRTCAKRTRYFARNELSRLGGESLRDGERLSTDDIVGIIVEGKGFDAADSVIPRNLLYRRDEGDRARERKS
jgi:hypothetical protein